MSASKWFEITPDNDGLKLFVQVSPKASRSQIAGLIGDSLKIKLAAAPVDGAANKELVSFLAKLFKIPKSAVYIVSGHTSKRKVVIISCADPEQALKKIGCVSV